MIRDPMDVFLADFAEDDPVEFEWETAGGTESRSLSAIFDDSFVDAQTGETILDTTQPRLTCKTADAAGIPREAITIIRGKVYSVTQVQPDGTGMSTIQLAHEP